jgi:hypothetical protein
METMTSARVKAALRKTEERRERDGAVFGDSIGISIETITHARMRMCRDWMGFSCECEGAFLKREVLSQKCARRTRNSLL